MPKTLEQTIFQNGSTTYYWSSRFFPKAVREDVFKLYSFVRVADDCVDALPANAAGFAEITRLWVDPSATSDNELFTRVVDNLRSVASKYQFDPAWAEAFLASMQMDLGRRRYQTMDDTLEYVYGSAEVIGLMMARIMGLPPEADEAARLQGRAMQWINFLRDIAEDNQLGRCYIPAEDLQKCGLKNLSQTEVSATSESFNRLMQLELSRYHDWQAGANNGFQYIPHRLLAPLRTAVDMYNWTAQEIAKDPARVYRTKLKPRPTQVATRAIKRLLSAKGH